MENDEKIEKDLICEKSSNSRKSCNLKDSARWSVMKKTRNNRSGSANYSVTSFLPPTLPPSSFHHYLRLLPYLLV